MPRRSTQGSGIKYIVKSVDMTVAVMQDERSPLALHRGPESRISSRGVVETIEVVEGRGGFFGR